MTSGRRRLGRLGDLRVPTLTGDRLGERPSDVIAARARRGVGAVWGGARRDPSFLVIGTKRGGSTSLYRYLAAHPLVVEPAMAKGTRFFDLRYERGLDWYRRCFPPEPWMKAVERRHGGRAITGEGSAYYGFHPLAVPRAAVDLPGIRLVMAVRDPVDRLWSHYHYEVDRGFEDLTFDDAIAAEAERLDGEVERLHLEAGYVSFAHRHFAYVERGRYVHDVRRAIDAVGRDRLMVVASEQLFADPQATMNRVWSFLDLPEHDLGQVGAAKANTYDPVPADVRHRFAAMFHDDNESLFEVLGERFEWSRSS